jgi:predicted nucleotidyltransferase
MNENRGDNVMQRHEVLKILADHRDAMRQQFGVKSLALFGSVARPVGLFGLYALQDYLVQLLGCAVDVGTLDSLKPHIRARVLAESIDVS